MTTARSHFPELDFVRATAITLVIILHASSPVMYAIATVPPDVWAMHNLVDSAVRVCVPLFFMISGYLLLDPARMDAGNAFVEVGRRLLKIGIPLLAWSVFYQSHSAWLNGQPLSFRAFSEPFLDAWQGAAVYHLWFIYQLAIMYLCLPILRPLFVANEKAAIYFVCLWLFLVTVHFIANLAQTESWVTNYLDLGATGYFVVGYLVRRRGDPLTPFVAIAAAAVYFVSSAATFALTAARSKSVGSYVETYHEYLSLTVVVASVSAFIGLLYLGRRFQASPEWLKVIVASISAQSFGIYFIHVLILERYQYNVLAAPARSATGAAVAIALTAVTALAGAWFMAWLLRRLAITHWLAP